MGWGLEGELVRSKKITFIEVDVDERRFGLDNATYEQLRTTVTHIIRSAYRVKFNLSLASFDTNIRIARELVDLALLSPYASPAKFLFTNSIGTVLHHPTPGPVAEAPVPPESALTSRYSQSKWVIERILKLAQEYTPLRPISVRVGQIAGSETTEAWNTSE